LFVCVCFHSSTRPQLINTKTADNKMNLLHYLIELLQQQNAESLEFVDDLHFVERASKGIRVCSFSINVLCIDLCE
jgi:hypothetical protein